MTTRIGRLVFDGRPSVYEVSPGEIRIDGHVFAGTLAAAEAYREQVARLVDDAVVPIVIEDGFTGFARITDASPAAVGASMRGGWFAYQVTAVPVANHRLPIVESVMSGALRDEAVFGSSSGRPFHAVPGGAVAWAWMLDASSASTKNEVRAVEGGTVLYRRVIDGYSGTARWQCPPDRWYEGGCRVETDADGQWAPVVGRGSLGRVWRAGNGLVRFWVDGETFGAEWWHRDGRWGTQRSWTIADPTGPTSPGTVIDWVSASVDRNTPENVRLRLTGQKRGGGINPGAVDLWLSIRRGSPFVSCHFGGTGVALTPTPAVAVSQQSLSVRQSAAIDGEQWIVASTEDLTPAGDQATTGVVIVDVARPVSWGFAVFRNGDLVGSDRDTYNLPRSWQVAQTETVRVL